MRDLSELTNYLAGLGHQMIPYGELRSYGWTEEELDCAKALIIPKPEEQNKKAYFWIAGLLVPFLLVGIAFASELPASLQEYLDSNGTRGSPVAVVEGNVTYNNVTITSGSAYDVSNVSAESDQTAGSNPAAPINIAAVSVNSTLQNVTESISSGGGAIGPITYILPENLTEEQALLETEPLLKVYSGENKTLYVVDNHKFGDLIRWLLKRL